MQLLQQDSLLHDQPPPAVELVQAKTHKTVTGQNDADRGGGGGCGDYDDVEVFSLLWNLFSRKPKIKHTGHKHLDGFDGVCGDKEKNDDGGGDSFVAILFGGGGNVSN